MKTTKSAVSAIIPKRQNSGRRGTVIVLAVAMLTVVFGIAAFTVDFGMLNVTKGQIQNAADSAAHASMQELLNGIGPGAMVTSRTTDATTRRRSSFELNRFTTT